MDTTAGVQQQSGFICSAADNFQHTQNPHSHVTSPPAKPGHDIKVHIPAHTHTHTHTHIKKKRKKKKKNIVTSKCLYL